MISYAVTGRYRSGTSMLTRALAVSSDIPVVVDMEHDKRLELLQVDENYHPNPNGYFMPGDRDFLHEFPGHLMKVPLNKWRHVLPGEYLVARVVRDEVDRRRSWERAFKHEDAQLTFYDQWEREFMERGDISETILHYEMVLRNPLREFNRLVDSGWPINPSIAAEFVDKTLHRHTKENR